MENKSMQGIKLTNNILSKTPLCNIATYTYLCQYKSYSYITSMSRILVTVTTQVRVRTSPNIKC